MSLILDALRRAESERSSTPTTDRGEAQRRDMRLRRPLPMTTLVLINLTVFLAGAALAMWLLRSVLGLPPPNNTAVAAGPQPTLERAKPVQPSPAAPRPAPRLAPAEIQPPADQPQVESSAPTVTSVPSTPPESDLALDPDVYASLDDIAPLYASPYDASSEWSAATTPSQSAPTANPATLDPATFAAALAQQATGADGDAAQAEVRMHLEPQLRDMPAAYRSQFPSLTIQVHVYDPEPQRRWVLIDGLRYGEGSTLAAGPELVSIETDGIVLAFRGENIWWPLQR